jgi:hypothetical protein
MKNIVDWFDVKNRKHIQAYNNLMKTGAWEKDFIPVGMEFPPSWQVLVADKLADAYVAEKIAEWGDGSLDDLFIVRLYDGFDHEWMDITEPVTRQEADKIWNERTKNGTEKTKYDDIDYFAIFPADTTMLYSVEGVYKNRGK